MTIAGLWRYGDWRHVATGCTAQVLAGKRLVEGCKHLQPSTSLLPPQKYDLMTG